MISSKNKNILIDSCFWIGFLFPRDQYHYDSIQWYEIIREYNFIVPYPTLYETVNTKLKRNKPGLIQFERIIKQPNVKFLYDKEYVDLALEKSVRLSNIHHNISLVDWVIRLVLQDRNNKIDYLITYNERDFVDICQQRKVEIYGC